jgi:hypothetical protein
VFWRPEGEAGPGVPQPLDGDSFAEIGRRAARVITFGLPDFGLSLDEANGVAHFWIDEHSENAAEESPPGDWAIMPLEVDAFAISGDPAGSALTILRDGNSASASRDRAARLLRLATSDGPETWVIVGSAAVSVNGQPLDTGIRVLRDRDELRIGGGRTFFSTEALAHIVAFPGGAGKTFCARCKLELVVGSPAVRCPNCQTWHHQRPEGPEPMPCWLYTENCAMCDQPTSLDAAYRWTPEGL